MAKLLTPLRALSMSSNDLHDEIQSHPSDELRDLYYEMNDIMMTDLITQLNYNGRAFDNRVRNADIVWAELLHRGICF